MSLRMLDLFCGRWGWSQAFAARGWECVGVDLAEPPEIPQGCYFVKADVLCISSLAEICRRVGVDRFDFGCASSPCEEFSIFGLRMFHPDPPPPLNGIRLFRHAKALFDESELPHVMENVRSAQDFVGKAVNRCGPFALWGNAVPPILPQGIRKGVSIGSGGAVKGMTPAEKKEYRKQFAALQMGSKSSERQAETAKWATIPPELANCVATYAERLIEQKASQL